MLSKKQSLLLHLMLLNNVLNLTLTECATYMNHAVNPAVFEEGVLLHFNLIEFDMFAWLVVKHAKSPMDTHNL